MLSVSRYPKAYIEDCRGKVDTQLAAFQKLKGGAELRAFEPLFFNHMVLALDRYFNHRARGQGAERRQSAERGAHALYVTHRGRRQVTGRLHDQM